MSQEKNKKSASREWIDALLFAVIAASLIRWLLLEPFTIPTASMEKSLLVGDFLFVSKMHYGTRVPKTILQVPLTHQKIWGTELKSYSEAIQLPYYRLPGFTSIKRNDVVVFNFPEEFQYPVDLKTNYIKRAVAIPGDVLEIKEAQLFVNGKASENPEEMQFSYDVIVNRPLNAEFFDRYGINPDSYYPFSDNSGYFVFATDAMIKELEQSPAISSIQKRISKPGQGDANIFPDGAYFKWNKDNFGPLEVPANGQTITLNEENVRKYAFTIEKFEGHENVTVEDNKLFIDGEEQQSYTFNQNYYFMMGDNRHDSLDSRFWGFVPEDHVVGKAWFLWLSLEKHKTMFNKIRWDRFFKPIN
ncbi:signal peptidase I [Cyclobacterium marinum]|uniref:Signal peptidase I n=1 Tax=Cyclobacterium marinum (strain ATCC 25205 / DSM 745 / LMG 13164 / NCIMB 1802) TaxID=880070 RepID=G0IYV3_CYCMS|nr:signal peptidase I [Cyclobacterium marinum]AEL28098.1 signal peptidase I [Cyclobacterium marinum DSM 745]